MFHGRRPPNPHTPCSYLPKEEVLANPFMALAATRRGGHLAFLQGMWPLGASYADAAVDDWLACALVVASEGGSVSWEERAAAAGWESPLRPLGGGDVAEQLAHARCNCLQRRMPELAAAQAAAAAPAAGGSGAAAAGSAGVAPGSDRRWRLDEVVGARGQPLAAGLRGGRWGLLGGGPGASAAAKGRSGANGADRVAVPPTTLEVPSPTLDRRLAVPANLSAAPAAVPAPTALRSKI